MENYTLKLAPMVLAFGTHQLKFSCTYSVIPTVNYYDCLLKRPVTDNFLLAGNVWVIKSTLDYSAIMRNGSLEKNPGGHTTHLTGAANCPESDRPAREFTGNSCLALEMPRNPSPPTHCATIAFARFSSIVFASLTKLSPWPAAKHTEQDAPWTMRMETFKNPRKPHRLSMSSFLFEMWTGLSIKYDGRILQVQRKTIT